MCGGIREYVVGGKIVVPLLPVRRAVFYMWLGVARVRDDKIERMFIMKLSFVWWRRDRQ